MSGPAAISPPLPDGAAAPSVGRPYGRYTLLEDLGRGGMAVVSRAVMAGPRGFARTVVIKRVLAELASQPSFVDMLATEARLSALLNHPAIVQVHELGQHDGEYFLAMEFVDGIDLLDLLKTSTVRRQRLPMTAACHLVGEVAGALGYAHALVDVQGRPLEIVHRDVSPSNIMVTKLGEVKLLDFGIAKAASYARDENTVTGTLKGKISYLSPEQADGMPIDRRSDIFSLGIVFHECLTMQRLFRGASDFESMRLIREARVRPPSHQSPGVPPELDAIVLKMLARDPADRFATCEELVEALVPVRRRLHADESSLRDFMRRLGPVERRKLPAQASPVAPPAEPRRLTRQIAPRLRRRWPIIAGSALATLAVTLLLLQARAPARDAAATAVTAAEAATSAAATSAAATNSAAANSARTSAAKPAHVTQAARADLPAPAPPATRQPAAAADRVRLTVTGTRDAELLVDGRLVGTLPAAVVLPRASGERKLRVQAPGLRPWSRAVAADVDVTLEIKLARLVAAPAPRRRRAPSSSSLIKDPFQP